MRCQRAFIQAMLPLALLTLTNLRAQTYEVQHDSVNAFGWFGGDDRSTVGPRSVGVGQSVFIDTSITLESFAFYFRGPFDYAQNREGKGHEVTLTLNVRDSLGAILITVQTVVADTFNAGWVSWTGIDLSVAARTTLIFTTYLGGAYDSLQVRASQGADQNLGYLAGQRYGKDGVSDADMEDWTDWNVHPWWDSAFQLRGTIQSVTGVKGTGQPLPEIFLLQQNYPNPFNPSTSIPYSVAQPGDIELIVYNLFGRAVRTLFQGPAHAGEYTAAWDGRDDAGYLLSSGPYYYQLKTGDNVQTRRMLFLK